MFRWPLRSASGKDAKEVEEMVEDNDKEEKLFHLKTSIGTLSKRESLFCDDSCLKRYLEARNWNVDKAKKMLEETMKWRSVYKPEEIRWHEVCTEGETGKVYRANFHDHEGRTVIVMKPAKQNTKSQDNQVRHLVYLLENAILNLPEGLEQMVWLIDFTGWSMTKGTTVPIKTAKETIDVLQNHYPERLSSAFFFNPPRIFEAFWKVVKYFLDPKTFQKVKFIYSKDEKSIEQLKKNFDFNILPVEFGGETVYEFNQNENSILMSNDDIKMDTLLGLNKEDKSHSSTGNSG
ncbi:CRAL/TRIO domain containing protein, expressed [Zostera marina]|uniref:CRAL/TRIO domain containing protein, expressed n=1 Tax=Zostera marina TaxID=29655 RepID=A0A0K9NN45_ZOSMR|nr:CRAL/TRIO domain containing protein, expressed [Zostera marina]